MILIEKVIFPVIIRQPVRIIEPSDPGRKMISRPHFVCNEVCLFFFISSGPGKFSAYPSLNISPSLHIFSILLAT